MSRGGGWHTGYVESEWYLQSVMLRRRPPRARFQPLPLTVKRCYIHPGILMARFSLLLYIWSGLFTRLFYFWRKKLKGVFRNDLKFLQEHHSLCSGSRQTKGSDMLAKQNLRHFIAYSNLRMDWSVTFVNCSRVKKSPNPSSEIFTSKNKKPNLQPILQGNFKLRGVFSMVY